MIRSAVAVVILATTLSSPALAIPAKFVEGRISIADLDLSDEADVDELNRRIVRTARDLCVGDLPKELWDSPEAMACQESVVVSGKAKLSQLVAANCLQSQVAARRK